MRKVVRHLWLSSGFIVCGFGGPMSGLAGVVPSIIGFRQLDFAGSV